MRQSGSTTSPAMLKDTLGNFCTIVAAALINTSCPFTRRILPTVVTRNSPGFLAGLGRASRRK